jgi:hypothetical protein
VTSGTVKKKNIVFPSKKNFAPRQGNALGLVRSGRNCGLPFLRGNFMEN